MNLRLVLLFVAGLFVACIFFDSLRRSRRQKKMITPDCGALDFSVDEQEKKFGSYDDGIIGEPRSLKSQCAAPRKHPRMREPAEEAQRLGDLIVFYIMAPTDEKFVGYELLQSIQSTGLSFSDNGVFHYFEQGLNEPELLFSLASAAEPGTIDVDRIGAYSTTGLVLFMDIRKVSNAMKAFAYMLETTQQLVEDLDGRLFDTHRQPCTQRFLEVCHAHITERMEAQAEFA